MAEFQRLPSRIQESVQSQLAADEQVQLCLLGRSEFLTPDFVIITSHQVLVLDERSIGSFISASYANIRCNLPFSQITAVKLDRCWKHRVFGQARLEIDKFNGDKYLINNVSHRDAKRAFELISSQIVRKQEIEDENRGK